MIWGGWECMAAEELAIKREGGKFWRQIFWELLRRELFREGGLKADCAKGFQNCVEKGVDLFLGARLDWLQTFSAVPVANQASRD
jgi:hypothetical protein